MSWSCRRTAVPRETPADGLTDAQRELLGRYVELLLAAPLSLTAIRDPAEAWARHVEDALPVAALVHACGARSAVDVGSGGGSPGIPVAVAAGVPVTLLEATGTKAGFLRDTVAALDLPCDVVNERSETAARGAGRDAFDVALARALAPPPVAVELCLPLVRAGGVLLLLVGDADERAVAAAAAAVAGRLVRRHPAAGRRGILEIAKEGATPARFPRRPGAAGKRPLGSVRSPP